MKVKDLLHNRSEYLPNPTTVKGTPQASILLPTFCRNKSGYLKKAVESVLHQSFQNFELIIIDDGSTDGTFDYILSVMEKDSRVSCIRHTENIGLPAISVYEAFLKSTGQFIAFMFDDNYWDTCALERMISFCQSNKKLAAYGIVKIISGEEEVEIGSSSVDISELRYTNIIANAAVLLHRDVLLDVGLFDPHLSLIRNCDYDLWLRIIEKYEFVATDVFVGYEYGPSLSDSLGNSYKLDTWASKEYMRQSRNKILTPDIYHDFNPLEVPSESSEYFIICMKEYIAEHIRKPWYSSEFLKEIDKSINNAISVRRVAVLTLDITASLMTFYRINKNSRLIILFFPIAKPFDINIAMADAVVISRNLDVAADAIQMVKTLGTPLYYFVDDCFIELDGKEDIYIKRIAALTNPEYLSNFYGVILSTPALMDYYRERDLHKNLILLEPAMPELTNRIKLSEPPVNLNVAFLGGAFRENVLCNCVIPALKKLSAEFPVTFYCPDDQLLRERICSTGSFKVCFIKRTKCLEQLLAIYNSYGIDIQIHCGEETPNNHFKTINALMNSALLGAILITSEVDPFKRENSGLYLTAENNIKSWFAVLSGALDNSIRTSMIGNAEKFCYSQFNSTEVISDFENQLMQRPENNMYAIQKKYAVMYVDLLKTKISEPSGFVYYLNKVYEYVKAYGFLGIFLAIKRAVLLLKKWLSMRSIPCRLHTSKE